MEISCTLVVVPTSMCAVFVWPVSTSLLSLHSPIGISFITAMYHDLSTAVRVASSFALFQFDQWRTSRMLACLFVYEGQACTEFQTSKMAYRTALQPLVRRIQSRTLPLALLSPLPSRVLRQSSSQTQAFRSQRQLQQRTLGFSTSSRQRSVYDE
jgi:hypothetical protein